MFLNKPAIGTALALCLIAGSVGGYAIGVSTTSAKVEIREVAVAPALVLPSAEEATLAWNQQRRRNPTGYMEDQKPDHTIVLGDCAPSQLMPGVMCMSTIQANPEAKPYNRNVNFSRAADGSWVAIPV